tara:strand:- start:1696 stop:1893 length:198 start_codon:yes stop_codon:yes gene_type:complete
MKVKLKGEKMDSSFSYRGFSTEDWAALNKGEVVEVDTISKHAVGLVEEVKGVTTKSKTKTSEGDK